MLYVYLKTRLNCSSILVRRKFFVVEHKKYTVGQRNTHRSYELCKIDEQIWLTPRVHKEHYVKFKYHFKKGGCHKKIDIYFKQKNLKIIKCIRGLS